MKSKVLIADDEVKIRRVMVMLLKDEGYEVMAVENGVASVKALSSFKPDIVLLDQQMPDMTGMEAMLQIKNKNPNQTIIIVTAYGSISLAVDAIKNGAYDFIEKPFDNDKLLLTVKRAIEFNDISNKLTRLKGQLKENYSFWQIIGNSPKLQQVMAKVRKIAETTVTVLVLGESGVGKELIVRQIHNYSQRSEKPLITVNCGAIPLTLIESELFGHEKGAFTDAKETQIGTFEKANGSTLFLDEIGELPLDAQVKLLRVLEERVINRVGGKKSIPIDVRIIAATNRNLEEKVRQGTFRLDLLYRLNIFTINVPPLRERREDVPLLVDYFIMKYNKILNLTVNNISQQAVDLLKEYDWPGNIRDLENAIQSAMILSQTGQIIADHLPMRIKVYPRIESILLDTESDNNKIRDASEHVEKELIVDTLMRYNYNRTLAAEALNISRKTLFNKMKKYGI
ncbi:MAG: sigma-54 dependent transcriptional regulator [Prevotellaceae bacterium]|nr:sigma-54 dependent transcriptional regulator [Prevotellaceae bacterium]